MRYEYTKPPEFIASKEELSEDIKSFATLLFQLCHQYGHCFATNDSLSAQAGIAPRTVRKYLKILKDAGVIEVELDQNYKRKIFVPLPVPPPLSASPFSLPFFFPHTPINILSLYPPLKELKYIYTKDTEGADAPSSNSQTARKRPQKNSSGVVELPKSMTRGAPPTPGPKAMVAESLALLAKPIKIGSCHVLIHQDDRPWFAGFSPATVIYAIERVSKESRQGTRIANIPAKIFAECARIRRENRSPDNRPTVQAIARSYSEARIRQMNRPENKNQSICNRDSYKHILAQCAARDNERLRAYGAL